MTNTIYKYPLQLKSGAQEVSMPDGAEILHVADQGGHPTIWALVDTEAKEVVRAFGVFGTGHPCPDHDYIGTAHANGFVWHIFEASRT